MHKLHVNRRQAMGLALALGAGSLHAQSGGRPLAFVVPQPAGNPTDAIARKLQPFLQRELGQGVVVENLPGAGGSIGVSRLLSAAADVPALLIASQTEPILTPLGLSGVRYKPEELRSVGLAGRGPYVLAGRADLPAANLGELMALARRSAAKPLSFGHIGHGSMIHLLGESWARRVNAPLTQVPYRGVPPVIQDLLGGQVDLTFLPLGGSTATLIDSGKVKAYGTTTAAQVARLAKVPALSTQDAAMRDFVHGTWGAMFVSRAMPEAMVERIHLALQAAMREADFVAFIAASGLDLSEPLSLAQLDQFYQSEIRLYQQMARELGLKPQ